MRINPIINYNYNTSVKSQCKPRATQPNFQGNHDTLKLLTATFGSIATVGAAVGTTLISGGIALPFVIAYGALGAATGAGLGHMIDREGNKNDKNKED